MHAVRRMWSVESSTDPTEQFELRNMLFLCESNKVKLLLYHWSSMSMHQDEFLKNTRESLDPEARQTLEQDVCFHRFHRTSIFTQKKEIGSSCSFDLYF